MILWHIAALCYHLCQSLCSGETILDGRAHNIVDLSYEFNDETIYWVTGKSLEVTVTHNGTDPDKGFWYQSEEISAATHGGTHMDAPCHFALGRWCISEVPIDKLVVPVAVVDISQHVKDDPNVHFNVKHLITWEKDHGEFPDGSVLIVRTGWARYWPDKLKYSGTTEKNVSQLKFPSIEPEVAQWIVSNRNIVGVGIDTMSLDIPSGTDRMTHRALADKNIYGIENVNDNLKFLPPIGATLYVMPMKLKGASGAPCRVFASTPKSDVSGGSCTTTSCTSVVFILTLFSIYMVWATSVQN